MDDNAQSHKAYVVSEYLQSGNITQMDWPPYSLDLNPNSACMGCLMVLNFNTPNFFLNPPRAEKCTFRRACCNSTRLYCCEGKN
ncbi:hypothetical protein X975_10189, partial [Stegodyphus mimosarum]